MSALEEYELLKKAREETLEMQEEKQVATTTTQEIEKDSPNQAKMAVTTAEEAMLPNKAVQEELSKAISNKVSQGGEIKELAKDLTYLAGASNLQADEDFTQAYQEELGKQLIEDLKDEGKRQAVVNAARKQESKNIRAQSFYNGCKPIFELLGIQEAYGLIPMVVTVVLLLIPFLVVSLVRFVFNSINSIATAVAGFKKPAFWLCTTVLYITITAAVVLAALWGIDSIFGTHIILR